MKPIYKRRIWKVLHGAAKELRLVTDHKIDPYVEKHIGKAIKILDDYFVEDMKRAEREQRKEK